MGYDADVEVLRPDSYEEPDSENSDEATSSTESEERWRHELVKYMKSLSCDPASAPVPYGDEETRGRKRRSKEAFGTSAAQIHSACNKSQLEVTEVAGEHHSRPRSKRLRRRSQRFKSEDGFIGTQPETETESGEYQDENGIATDPPRETVLAESSLQDDSMDLD